MMQDRDLAATYIETRSESAFRALYRRHTPFLYGMALRLAAGVETTAGELVQDTWVRAAERLDGFQWKSELRTWLVGILINCHREMLRRHMRDTVEPTGMDEVPARSDHVDVRLDMEHALAQLPSGYREIIVLYHVYGYTHRQIATLMCIDEGTSKSQLARGRKRLAALLT